MPVVAEARAVRGVRQNLELAVAVRELAIEIEQVVVGRIAVPLAADHQHRAEHLGRIDRRQVRRHVEIGAGRDRIAERHFHRDDRLGHRRVVAAGVTVAGEDRADHGGVALAPRVGAQLVDALAPPRDLRRAFALVGEGADHQAVDPLGLRLRVGAGADAAGRCAVEVHLLLAGLLHDDGNRGLQILDAARDVGIVARRAGIAVAVVVHGPDVVAVARKHVHERVFALARHREVIGRPRRVRGAVHEEQDRQRRLARLRRADALAPEVELHVALFRPVLVAPDIGGTRYRWLRQPLRARAKGPTPARRRCRGLRS